jgi:hypothetical protein
VNGRVVPPIPPAARDATANRETGDLMSQHAILAWFPIITAQQAAILGVIVVAITLLLRSVRRKLREAANTPRTYAREHYRRLQEEHTVVEDVGKVMLQLDALARDVHGQMDTRFARLGEAIREADARIASLRALLEIGCSPSGALHEAPPGTAGAAEKPENDETDVLVLRLAAEDVPPDEIARAVGRSVSEIRLILACGHDRSSSTVDPAAAPIPTRMPAGAAPRHSHPHTATGASVSPPVGGPSFDVEV